MSLFDYTGEDITYAVLKTWLDNNTEIEQPTADKIKEHVHQVHPEIYKIFSDEISGDASTPENTKTILDELILKTEANIARFQASERASPQQLKDKNFDLERSARDVVETNKIGNQQKQELIEQHEIIITDYTIL